MKTTVLVILLFGFGYLAPFSCGKQQHRNTKKSGVNASSNQPKLALFYPIVMIKDNKRSV